MLSPARKLAYDTLLKVEAGAYSTELLHASSGSLDPRDEALASELVLGVLRRQSQVDYLIELDSKNPVSKLDPEVRIALRLGVYQLRFLDRIPAHAAVSESVELVKRARKVSAAGMVNAILRKQKPCEVQWPSASLSASLPLWLHDKWRRDFGFENAESIGRAFLERPESYIRVPVGGETQAFSLGAEITSIPGCFRLPAAVRSTGFRFQDIGSQCIVPLLDLKPGQTLLDLCAAPGNKTAQSIESGVRVIACDLHLFRLRGVKDLGCDLVVLDASEPLPFNQKFDRILLDAPCSGTGTIGRNPEIKWRVQPKDLERMQRLQVKMLCNVLDWLAPGGKLVYSTCSLEIEENEQVIDQTMAASDTGLRVAKTMKRIPGRDPGDGFFAAVITSGKPPNPSLK
jgi:16S rRNA (cytosine967-C5)-methyltransferase